MWSGYETWLATYGICVCSEWTHRGYADSCADQIDRLFHSFPMDVELPPWLGDPDFHRSHQSNLIRKFPEHYAPMFPGVPDDIPYVWPTTKERTT